MLFIRNNLRYPALACQQGIEGTVYVSFIVETDGSVSEVHVIRGISPEADAGAVRVVRLSPNWIPARQDGIPVKQRIVLPIEVQTRFPGKGDGSSTASGKYEQHSQGRGFRSDHPGGKFS